MFATTVILFLAAITLAAAQEAPEPEGAGKPDGVGKPSDVGADKDKPIKEKAPSAEGEPSAVSEASEASEPSAASEGEGRPDGVGGGKKALEVTEVVKDEECLFASPPMQQVPPPDMSDELLEEDVTPSKKRAVAETRSFQILAGQKTEAGTVTIDQEGKEIKVTVDTSESEWSVQHIHIFAGPGWPTEWESKAPPPGSFPINVGQDAASFSSFSTSFTIGEGALANVCGNAAATGGTVAIAVHTESVKLGADGQVTQSETGWAKGEKEFGGSRWGWYTTLCVPCDGTISEEFAAFNDLVEIAEPNEAEAESKVEEAAKKIKEKEEKDAKEKKDKSEKRALKAKLTEGFKGNERATRETAKAIKEKLDKELGKPVDVVVDEETGEVTVVFPDAETQDAGLRLLANLAIVESIEPTDVPSETSASVDALVAAAATL